MKQPVLPHGIAADEKRARIVEALEKSPSPSVRFSPTANVVLING
jgi:hypothetical protein